MGKPRYFVAKFGDQLTPPKRDPVEGGRYIPRHDWANYEEIREGDLALLYCTGSYIGYDKEVPGVGVVLRVEPPAIHYRYLAFYESIVLDNMRGSFLGTDIAKLDNLRFNSFNIFEISKDSFEATVMGRLIDWSKI